MRAAICDVIWNTSRTGPPLQYNLVTNLILEVVILLFRCFFGSVLIENIIDRRIRNIYTQNYFGYLNLNRAKYVRDIKCRYNQ